METLSSFFLPRHPQLLLHVPSSFKINVKKPPQPMTTAKSSFPTFDSFKKFMIKHTSQTFETPMNPSTSSKHVTTKQPNYFSNILNTFDDLICIYLDLPLRPSIDPKHVLSGHAAPVDELPPTACHDIEGSLPPCLDGAYIRNGPNPQFVHPKRPHHFFEGDGMLHMIKISQGKATFCSRYIETNKYLTERESEYPLVTGDFSSLNGPAATIARVVLRVCRYLSGQFDPIRKGYGTANAGLALISRRLFAFNEMDLPYEIKATENGDIITLGRHDFQAKGELFLRMTAHPKVDHETGRVFAFAYEFLIRPYLTFFRIDSDGKKQKGVPITSMEECAAIHDLGVTEKHVVFSDVQIVVRPWWILRGRSPLGVDHDKIPRLGIIPKYAEDDSEMWWIDTPGLNVMHYVNAWEEDGGDTIVIVGSNGLDVDKFLDNFRLADLKLEKITITVGAKTVRRQLLSTENLDFGVINPAYDAKKVRYVYASIIDKTSWVGVAKLDLWLATKDGGDCTVASCLYGPGCNGGEPFFVPKEPNNPTAEEDDGYLVTYVHDGNTQESKFLVMDAKSPTLDIIAAVKLPQRVPDGFHGFFVPESDLRVLCEN